MYRKTVRGWLKHLDFILIDEICLLFSSLAAFQLITFLHLRFDDSNPNGVLFLILFINLAVIIAFDTMDNILVRDALAEFRKTVIQAFLVLSFVLLSFVIRNEQLDRAPVTYAVAMLLYIFSTFLLRQGRKAVLHKKREDNEERKAILIVTEEKSASEILQRMKTYSFSAIRLQGLFCQTVMRKGKRLTVYRSLRIFPMQLRIYAGPGLMRFSSATPHSVTGRRISLKSAARWLLPSISILPFRASIKICSLLSISPDTKCSRPTSIWWNLPRLL